MKSSSFAPRSVYYLFAFISTLMIISSVCKQTHGTDEVLGEGIDGLLFWGINTALLTCPKINFNLAGKLTNSQISRALEATSQKMIVSQSANHFYQKNSELQKQDMQFLQQTIEQLLRTKKIAHACKVNTLLTQWPEFKIFLVGPGKNAIQCTEMSGAAFSNFASFNNVEKTITLVAGFSQAQQSTLLDILAHEFRHALSTFNNLQNRNSLMVNRNGIFAMSNVHGISPLEIKPLDINNHNRLMNGIAKDIQRLNQLFYLFHMEQSKLNQKQKAQLAQFINIVEDSGYQPRVDFFPLEDVTQITDTMREYDSYQYDHAKKFYRLKQNAPEHILRSQSENPIMKNNPIEFYIVGVDVSEVNKGFYKTYTHPYDKSAHKIAYDVLVNIIMDVENVHIAYAPEVHIEEIDACTDGHIGEFPELSQYLLPTLYNNRLERSGSSFARCL